MQFIAALVQPVACTWMGMQAHRTLGIMISPTGPDAPNRSPTASHSAGALAALRQGFIAYARWLDSISWKRFFLLSLLALILMSILAELPPFNIRWGSDRQELADQAHFEERKQQLQQRAQELEQRAREMAKMRERQARSRERAKASDANHDFSISINKDGVSIKGVKPPPAPPAPPVDPARPVPPVPAASSASALPDVHVDLPDDADTSEIKKALEEARLEIEQAMTEAKESAVQAAAEAAEEAREVAHDLPSFRTVRAFRLGDHMPGFTLLVILVSMIVKIMAAGRFKAEAQAVVSAEIAESEVLKRQVVEARMAAMQAQVEPHFLFNTLASIDHLIETEPPRASKMQKNLIALLRASMPTMREANAQGTRTLGRELDVIRPYLEILKVRMEERLITEVRVSDGLLSAEFPPMMLQSLVENAIKHGLEPKADGGKLAVQAEIVHGKLAVTVTDTGLGFGKSATAGTGIGLNNIRERLQLLFGAKASLVITEPEGGGTSVTITIPYVIARNGGPV